MLYTESEEDNEQHRERSQRDGNTIRNAPRIVAHIHYICAHLSVFVGLGRGCCVHAAKVELFVAHQWRHDAVPHH